MLFEMPLSPYLRILLNLCSHMRYIWVVSVICGIFESLCYIIYLRLCASFWDSMSLCFIDIFSLCLLFEITHMKDLWVCVCVSFIYSSVSLNKITLTHVHCLQWVCVERLRFAGCGVTSQRTHHSGGSSAVNKSGGSPRQQSTNKSSVTWLGAASWLVERFMKQ